MEKTIYEIKYNDWFTVRMTSEREPMEEIAFVKTAFEAVLTDIVMRDETVAIWQWVCTQIGQALQSTELVRNTEEDPLDTVIDIALRLKRGTE